MIEALEATRSAREMLDRLPPELCETLLALAGAPWEVAVAVFQLLPEDERQSALDWGLAVDAGVIDADTGVRDIRPSLAAWQLISQVGQESPTTEATVSVDDLHRRAQRLAESLVEGANSGSRAEAHPAGPAPERLERTKGLFAAIRRRTACRCMEP